MNPAFSTFCTEGEFEPETAVEAVGCCITSPPHLWSPFNPVFHVPGRGSAEEMHESAQANQTAVLIGPVGKYTV